MCRARNKENRRCSCDSSEARRLRYGISLAKRIYNLLTVRPSKPNFLLPLEDTSFFTVENLKNEIEALHTFENPGLITNANLIAQDRRLNLIGEGVEFLAITKYDAPTDEELVETEEASAQSFKMWQDEATEAYQKYKAQLLASGRTAKEAADEAEARVNEEMRPESHVRLCSLLEKRNNAYKNALMDLGVQFANPESLAVSSDSDAEVLKSLRKAITFYPQSWVDLSNKSHREKMPLQVKKSNKRGHYRENYDTDTPTAELEIRTDLNPLVGDDMTSNATHEFAHRISALVSSIDVSEKTFLLRRAGHIAMPDGSRPKPEELSWIDSDKKEKGFRDNLSLIHI